MKNEEQSRFIALQAWMNQSVQATRKSGKDYKSIYKNFGDFYNTEEEFKNIFTTKKEKPKLLTLADKNRLLSKKGGN